MRFRDLGEFVESEHFGFDVGSGSAILLYLHSSFTSFKRNCLLEIELLITSLQTMKAFMQAQSIMLKKHATGHLRVADLHVFIIVRIIFVLLLVFCT